MKAEEYLFKHTGNGDLARRDLEAVIAEEQYLHKFMLDIEKWRNLTFPNSTALSHVRHLQKEVQELADTLIESAVESPLNQSLRMELADCFILTLNTATMCKFTANDLLDAAIEKMVINKRRKWNKPDKDGVVEHIK